MNGISAVAGVAFLIIFLFGVFLGIVVIASISFNRDRLNGAPPDSASSGTRWLVGMRRRDYRPGQFPREQPGQDGGTRGERA